MLTQNAITGFIKHTRNTIHSAQYRVGSIYHKAPIDRVEQTGVDEISIFLVINPELATSSTITEVRFLGVDGQVWFSQTENITVKAFQEGVLYKFSFKFTSSTI